MEGFSNVNKPSAPLLFFQREVPEEQNAKIMNPT